MLFNFKYFHFIFKNMKKLGFSEEEILQLVKKYVSK